MSESRTVTERDAIRAVERYVESDWMSRWQEYAARNDDGIDGVIMLRKKRLDKNNSKPGKRDKFISFPICGEVFVQVKGGDSYAGTSLKRPDTLEVSLKQEYIESHRPRWNAAPGPVILVYVNTEKKKQNLDAWWVDLKSEASFCNENKQIVLVPLKQKFGPHSKGDMRDLVGPSQYDEQLPTIRAESKDLSYFHFLAPLKKSASEFYRQWAKLSAQERNNPKLGEIIVSRVGWRHITRSGRRIERINQSLQLLGVAKRILSEVGDYGWLGRMAEKILKNGAIQRRELLGIRAKVLFPWRHESVIQVILERKRTYKDDTVTERVWFYSVYEARRQSK